MIVAAKASPLLSPPASLQEEYVHEALPLWFEHIVLPLHLY